MSYTTIETKSGQTLAVCPASMRDAMALKNAIVSELGSAGINLDLKGLKDISAESDINSILPIIAKIDSSEKIQDALWNCLIKCTWNGEKIDEKLFDVYQNARVDYYEIAFYCVKVNLELFFKNLFSVLGEQLKKQTENQK